MSSDAESILLELRRVDAERIRRKADASLGARVDRVKAYQQDRFRRSYADLLESERFGPAARFFLVELYGPADFSDRDAQFARVIPALVRLFPRDVVHTVRALVELHALTEELDSELARRWVGEHLDRRAYVRAWQATGRRSDRERQIALTISVGGDLDRLTRKPMLRQTLHLMRGPARAAGLGSLQEFLESGFAAFRSMGGAQPFLEEIERRERTLVDALFACPAGTAVGTTERAAEADCLGQLP